MLRIFLGLVFVHAAALLSTVALGFSFDPHAGVPAYHWYAGLWTCVLTLLVHSIVLTYFIGTGRWVREVSDVYGFEKQLYAQTWKAKVRAVPFAVVSMLLMIGATALGAAADPGATVRVDAWMGLPASTLHLLAVVVAVCGNGLSHVVEYRAVRANAEVIDQVMHQVARVRRGSDATAVVQQSM